LQAKKRRKVLQSSSDGESDKENANNASDTQTNIDVRSAMFIQYECILGLQCHAQVESVPQKLRMSLKMKRCTIYLLQLCMLQMENNAGCSSQTQSQRCSAAAQADGSQGAST
jgi:hypothetical protein